MTVARPFTVVAWLVSACAAMSCGPAEVETVAAPADCPLPALEQPPSGAFLLVDDLEDGDLAGNNDGTLAAGWDFWRDETEPNPQSAEVSNQCAAVGRRALHIMSVRRHDGWGGSANLFFRPAPRPQPFDARAWNAVSFYMAVSPGGSPRNIRASVSTMDTAWNGRCTKCVDNFGAVFAITDRWHRFVLPFADGRQLGWGVPQVAFDAAELVQFHLSLEQDYDVWVDHIRFERLP